MKAVCKRCLTIRPAREEEMDGHTILLHCKNCCAIRAHVVRPDNFVVKRFGNEVARAGAEKEGVNTILKLHCPFIDHHAHERP